MKSKQKSIAFLYTSNNQVEDIIGKKTPFTIGERKLILKNKSHQKCAKSKGKFKTLLRYMT